MKRVSVVLPTYNGERYIEEAVRSVLKQTYQNLELIVVDDCSTDGTAEVVRRYAQQDGRIHLIRNAENQKLPRSLNIGFRQAAGDYLTWTSDDNYYDEDAIEEMVSFLERNPQAAMVYCDMYDLCEDGTRMRSNRVRPARYLYSGSNFGACFLYRRQAAEIVGEYDPDMFLAEDYDYVLRISKQFAVCHFPICKYTYRIHQESLSQTRTREAWKQIWQLRRRELNYLLEKIPREETWFLFLDMWLCYKRETWELRNRFFIDGVLPRRLKWMEQEMSRNAVLEEGKPLVLFGAGEHGRRALAYFGKERVSCFADNNQMLMGTRIEDVPVISFDQLLEIQSSCQIILTVGSRFLPEIIEQLASVNITNYRLFLEIWMNV